MLKYTKLISISTIIIIMLCLGTVYALRTIPAFAEIVADVQSCLAENTSIPRVKSASDKNADGVNDTDDIISGARLEVLRRPVYRSAYYQGGYPPETEGVCTDVIWRAFLHAGYDIKTMLDKDIKANRSLYPRVKSPDSNIDFRRVPNLIVFFKRYGLSLSTAIPEDKNARLALWQPGDIVTFTNPDHIAILSDKRNSDGFPLLLHNDGPVATEANAFERWYHRGVTGHFRLP